MDWINWSNTINESEAEVKTHESSENNEGCGEVSNLLTTELLINNIIF